MRRHIFLKKFKINYIGCGFSGGTHGARNDASLMVGCNKKNFRFLNKLFLSIIGRKNKRFLKRISDNPCSGHYVKLIHNGIEYAVMQSIADYYSVMKEIIKLNSNEIIKEITKLNKLIGNSYLLKITRKIIEKSKFKKFSIANIIDKIDDNLYFETPGNILKYLKILSDSNIDYSKNKLSCIFYLIDKYKHKKDPQLLIFISVMIEFFYNELSLKNNEKLSFYSYNKFKILKEINNVKKFNLDKNNLFISLQEILKNES